MQSRGRNHSIAKIIAPYKVHQFAGIKFAKLQHIPLTSHRVGRRKCISRFITTAYYGINDVYSLAVNQFFPSKPHDISRVCAITCCQISLFPHFFLSLLETTYVTDERTPIVRSFNVKIKTREILYFIKAPHATGRRFSLRRLNIFRFIIKGAYRDINDALPAPHLSSSKRTAKRHTVRKAITLTGRSVHRVLLYTTDIRFHRQLPRIRTNYAAPGH